MADVLYQDVKSEFLPERKVKIRSKTLPSMNRNIGKRMNQRYQHLLKAREMQKRGKSTKN